MPNPQETPSPESVGRVARAIMERAGPSRVGRTAEWFDTIDSTNRVALERGAGGSGDGHVVLADRQTAGRGRHRREWTADAGTSLLISILIRPESVNPDWGWLPLSAAVALAEAFEAFGGTEVAIKWPNDVLIGGLKAAGILVESRLDARDGVADGYAVVGIGANLGQQDFPPELARTATSLRLAIGSDVSRARFAVVLCDRLDVHISSWRERAGGLRSAYEQRLTGVGRVVQLRNPGASTVVQGVMRGIDDHGAIVVETEGGLRSFHSGDVTLGSA